MSIISGTPWWVFSIFAYLLYVGFAATRARIVWIPRLFIIPIILMSLKIKDLFLAENHMLLSYALCSLLGYYLGCKRVSHEHFKVIKADMSVKLQGSWSTFILLMSFFFIKYFFGFVSSEAPELAHEYRSLELGICGIFSWYFLGRAVGYWLVYKSA